MAAFYYRLKRFGGTIVAGGYLDQPATLQTIIDTCKEAEEKALLDIKKSLTNASNSPFSSYG